MLGYSMGENGCNKGHIHLAMRRTSNQTGLCHYIDPSPFLDTFQPVPTWHQECKEFTYKVGSCLDLLKVGSCSCLLKVGSCLDLLKVGSCLDLLKVGSCLDLLKVGSCLDLLKVGSCSGLLKLGGGSGFLIII